MIKQIQFRGISHRPSDRMSADGGLEECIDLRLEDQEHGPATAPKNVTDELAPGLSTSGIDVLYIHKTNTYTNYVGKQVVTENNTPVEKLVAYVFDHSINPAAWATKVVSTAVTFPIVSVTSIGNILIVSDGAGVTHYALYQDNAYKYLGTEIPRPTVKFRITSEAGATDGLYFSAASIVADYASTHSGNSPTPYELWEYVMSNRGKDSETGKLADNLYNTLHQKFWDYINAERHSRRPNNIFSAPVLARYAVKLYDGQYVHVSEPICLGNKANSYAPDFLANLAVGTGALFLFVPVLTGCFSATVDISYTGISNWSELIESVDVFLSTDVLLPSSGADFGAATQKTTKIDPDLSYNDISISIEGRSGDEVADFRTKLEEVSNFYRVESFKVKELPVISKEISPLSQDNLVVLPRLSENTESHFISAIGNLGSYNNRLVSGAQQITLSSGHIEPHAVIDDTTGNKRNYYMFYHVRDANGGDHLVQGYHVDEVFYDSQVRAFVSYPDTNCYQADLYYYSGGSLIKLELPMQEHPRLNCAYGFWGLDVELDLAVPIAPGGQTLPTSFNPTYKMDNRLAMSEMDNPFVFPLGQRERFSTKILAALPATIALSADQSGPLPIYIFTEDGIWAESITAEGTLANKFVVSRDVAIDGTIVQLDQAILFVSDQGVMLVQGRQVMNLSTFMNGPQYTIEDIAPEDGPLRAALTTDGFGDLLEISIDTTDFQDFVEGCKPLYDYGNKRVLFFNPDENYGYDYALDTQTWHKVSVPAGFVRTLNGYPQALAVFDGSIFEWSVRSDYNEESPAARRGWLLTRPFDLGEPDVRKAIKDIRIRGYYKYGDVKYILLGSMNGLKWQRLLSLRGGSYKLFRLLLLTNFTPDERISWIDIDYEVRFGNKLR